MSESARLNGWQLCRFRNDHVMRGRLDLLCGQEWYTHQAVILWAANGGFELAQLKQNDKSHCVRPMLVCPVLFAPRERSKKSNRSWRKFLPQNVRVCACACVHVCACLRACVSVFLGCVGKPKDTANTCELDSPEFVRRFPRVPSLRLLEYVLERRAAARGTGWCMFGYKVFA